MGTVWTLLLLLGPNTAPGYLTVHSNPPGFPVFLEGELAGTTPLERHPLEGGRYWVTIVSNDSLETLYSRLRSGGLGQRFGALWTLARLDAATTQVEILPGMETRVTFDERTMQKNACRAKWLFAGGVGGIFALGLISGLVIGMVAH